MTNVVSYSMLSRVKVGFTTGLQVTGAELLSSAVDSDGSPGLGPVPSSTRHRALRPRNPWLPHTFRHITHKSTSLLPFLCRFI